MGVPSSLKFLPGVGLGGGVKYLICFLEGGGGGPGNLETLGYSLAHCNSWGMDGKFFSTELPPIKI